MKSAKRYIMALAGVIMTVACGRTLPEEITELVLSNCLTPVLLDESVNDYDVRLSWTVGKDADAYRLVIASDAEYTEILRSDTLSVEEVPYVVTLDAGVYYYRVQALADDRGESHWAYGDVTVKRPVCATPTNLSAVVSDECNVTFSWDVHRDADAYGLVVATDAEYSDVIHQIQITGSSLPYTLTLENGIYYYKVQATSQKRDDSSWAEGEKIMIMKTQDLGVEETANCYIINKGGKYRFKTVKGRKDETVGKVAAVEVLWESAAGALEKGSLIEQAVKDGDDHLIFITAEPFREGNALIAAKDASGKILWSWHLWLSAEPVGDVDLGEGIVLMDRNIGEFGGGDDAYTGMLYQWGRKDPFPGTLSSGGLVGVVGTGITHKPGQMKGISESVENPTVFYGALSTESVGAQPYCLGVGTVDGITAGDYDYWGGIGSDVKTEYDPCPAGYRVPHAFEARFDNSDDLSRTRFSFLSGLQYSGGNFDMTMENGAVLSFRSTGCIRMNTSIDRWEEASGQIRHADDAFFWTASRNNKRIAGCIRVSGSDGAQFWGKAGDNTARYQAKNNAYPVRCEKIR